MHSSQHRPKTADARRPRAARPAQIGTWQLEAALGEGRWTRVYRAHPTNVLGNADYAVKTLKPEFRTEALAVSQLQREAQVARDLSHPNLISVLAAHIDGPPFFLVSPYLEGATLKDTLLAKDRLGVPHSLWVIRQVAEGLMAMHAHGWIHCDVKPDNIYIACNGHVTVCDLGLARRKDAVSSTDEPLVGTPAYLAPEALSTSVDVSAASDVFSLGVTLYQSLTGRLPFPAEDPTDLAEALLTHTPDDPRRFVPQIPASVTRLVRRMLAKTPLRRPHLPELIDQLVDLEIETFDCREAG